MLRSAHIALSPISFNAQFDIPALNRYSYENIHTASLGTARWADLSTSHHIKHSPKGPGLMWTQPISPYPTTQYAFNIRHNPCADEMLDSLFHQSKLELPTQRPALLRANL